MPSRKKTSKNPQLPSLVTTDVEPAPAQDAFGAVKRAAASAASATGRTATAFGASAKDAVRSASRAGGSMARSAAELGSKAVTVIGDLNGDGVVDEADFAIAKSAVGGAAKVALREAGELGKSVVRRDLTKDAATGAAVGAVIAIPVPFVGPVAGATVGAMIGVARNVLDGGAGAVAEGVVTGLSASGKPKRRAPSKRASRSPKVKAPT